MNITPQDAIDITAHYLSLVREAEEGASKPIVISSEFDVAELGVPQDIASKLGYDLQTFNTEILDGNDFFVETMEGKFGRDFARGKEDKGCILYFSNVGEASREVLSSIFKLAMEREIYGTRLPANYHVILQNSHDDMETIPASLTGNSIGYGVSIDTQEWLATHAVEANIAVGVQTTLAINSHLLIYNRENRRLSPGKWDAISKMEKMIFRNEEDYASYEKLELLEVLVRSILHETTYPYIDVVRKIGRMNPNRPFSDLAHAYAAMTTALSVVSDLESLTKEHEKLKARFEGSGLDCEDEIMMGFTASATRMLRQKGVEINYGDLPDAAKDETRAMLM